MSSHTAAPRDNDELRVSSISAENIETFEDLVRAYLEPVVEHDMCLTVDHVIDRICDGTAVGLVVHDGPEIYGVCSVIVEEYPGATALEVMTACGHSFDRWGPLMTRVLDRFARERGVDVVRAYCRPGLGATLRKLDLPEGRWRRVMDVMEWRLDG